MKELLANSNIDEAIKKGFQLLKQLNDIEYTELYDNLIMISGSYRDLTRKINLSLVSEETERAELAKIRKAIIYVADKISKHNHIADNEHSSTDNISENNITTNELTNKTENFTDEKISGVAGEHFDFLPIGTRIEVSGGEASLLMLRGMLLPNEKVLKFTSANDKQTELSLNILVGESVLCKHNSIYYECYFTGIPELEKGEAEIKLKIIVDNSLNIKVSATDEKTNKKLVLKTSKRHEFVFSDSNIQKYIELAHKNYEEDKKELNFIRKKAEAMVAIEEAQKRNKYLNDNKIKELIAALGIAIENRDIDKVEELTKDLSSQKKEMSMEDVFSQFGNIFGGGFVGGFGTIVKKQPYQSIIENVDIKIDLAVSKEERKTGVTIDYQFERYVKCYKCNGSGKSWKKDNNCTLCGGTEIVKKRHGILKLKVKEVQCPNCICDTCMGLGAILKNELINIKVPPNTDLGSILKIHNKGHILDKDTYGNIEIMIEDKMP